MTNPTGSVPRGYLQDLTQASVWAGVTAFIFLIFGALSLQVSVLDQFPISSAERSSWISITWLTTALVGLPACFYYRQPLAIAWSIPGLVYIGSLANDFTLEEIAVANLLAGAAITVLGATGIAEKAIYVFPMPILMGMFAGSILEYETRLVDATISDVEIAGPMVAAYLAGRLLDVRSVPPVGLAVVVGLIASLVFESPGEPVFSSSLPTLTLPGLDFSVEACLTVTLPMVVLVLGLGNVQSLGFMIAEGYRPPVNIVSTLIGGMTVVNALFGGHPAAMARTVTAIVAGREAGKLEGRYWAGVVALTGALGVAFLGGFLLAAIAVLPAAFVFAMAGLAIFTAFQDAMTRAFGDVLRTGAVIAFVVTLSTFSIAGIPSAFWALIAGIAVSGLLEHEELREYWRHGLGGEPKAAAAA